MKLESGGGADHNMSEPLVNSPETRRLMEIAIAKGASIRTAYKAVRKRLRIEARRQKELDDGVEPEVVLDSFLNQVELEQHPQFGPLKRVLTPAADGDRCNFKHALNEEKEQTVSGTGASWPGPSLRHKLPVGSTCDSWNISWDRYDYSDKWTDVWKGDHDGNRCIHGWNEHCHDDNWMDAWRKRKPGDEWRTSHWETSSRCSSHLETSGWNETDTCSNDREGQQWSNHSFFEIMNVDSLCGGDDDAATFSGIEVDPGESLADTASQSGVIDIRPSRKAKEALFHKFGLKPRGDNQAVGTGIKAKVLGKVEMPSGMGAVNGIVKKTLFDSPGVPPVTSVSLLKQVGAVVDLNNNMMDLKKIETTTSLRALPSGHVAHKLTEFAPGAWKAPAPEQTQLFQVRTEVFRPATLPGEFRPISSKQCAGFSSGFVYTVRDGHLSPSHHQHDPDLCVDDVVSFFSGDQLAQETSNFECSFASGFDVDANSGMEKLCADRRGCAWFTSLEHRGRSC